MKISELAPAAAQRALHLERVLPDRPRLEHRHELVARGHGAPHTSPIAAAKRSRPAAWSKCSSRRRARGLQRRPQVRVGAHALDGRGHERRRRRRHQDPGVADRLRDRGGAQGDDRHAVVHRLEQGHAEALVARQAHEHVGGPVVGRQLVGVSRSPANRTASPTPISSRERLAGRSRRGATTTRRRGAAGPGGRRRPGRRRTPSPGRAAPCSGTAARRTASRCRRPPSPTPGGAASRDRARRRGWPGRRGSARPSVAPYPRRRSSPSLYAESAIARTVRGPSSSIWR